jgi:hypothetical protein
MSELGEFNYDELFSLNSEFIPLIVGIVLGFLCILYFVYFTGIDKTNVLDNLERILNNTKDSISVYTNKLLLELNMDGSAVKTVQEL